jgi:hypothetical protein
MGLYELKNMSLIIGKTLFEKLALIETRDKYLNGTI